MLIESINYPGYFVIPGFSLFLINKKGEVIRLNSWGIKKPGDKIKIYDDGKICMASDNKKGKCFKISFIKSLVFTTTTEMPVYAFNPITRELVKTSSISEMSDMLGVRPDVIIRCCNQECNNSPWLFSFIEVDNWEALNKQCSLYKNNTQYTPIEHQFYKGFYKIPGFDKYLISKEGHVKILFDTAMKKYKTGDLVSLIERSSNYPKVSILNNENTYSSVGLCRLMCLAFNGEKPSDDYLVGFKDGDHSNISPDNLFWMVYQTTNATEKTKQRGNGCYLAYAFNRKTKELIEKTTPSRLKELTGVNLTRIANSIKNGSKATRSGWCFSLTKMSDWN